MPAERITLELLGTEVRVHCDDEQAFERLVLCYERSFAKQDGRAPALEAALVEAGIHDPAGPPRPVGGGDIASAWRLEAGARPVCNR